MKLVMTKDELVQLVKNRLQEIFPDQMENYDISLAISGYGNDVTFDFDPKPIATPSEDTPL